MADAPPAELQIDETLVRSLLRSQVDEDDSHLPLTHAADGWDCSVWRLGAHLAVRLPRRAVAAPLILNEHRWLPELADRIGAATEVRVPAPLYAGTPDPNLGYPWPWSVVAWIDGRPGLSVPRADRAAWARPLARALVALHEPAPETAPANPSRGVPLASRDEAMRERLDRLDGRSGAGDSETDRRGASTAPLRGAWSAALDAAPWHGAPVWIHGDLHPGNLIARDDRLVGIIDFGDMTAGDPAYDLAIAWLGFDDSARAAFVAELGPGYDSSTWTRARGWAAATTAMLLAHSDDNPAYAALGREGLAALT